VMVGGSSMVGDLVAMSPLHSAVEVAIRSCDFLDQFSY